MYENSAEAYSNEYLFMITNFKFQAITQNDIIYKR